MNRLWFVAGALAIALLAGCGKPEEPKLGIGTPAGTAGGATYGGPPGAGSMPRTSEARRAMAEKMGIKIPPARK